ncbi:MAG: hypothetical protein LLG00_06465 [Planctomycetaceae bacterium]|nr:hypothetical protein [Planctomycetaceae bacterium]
MIKIIEGAAALTQLLPIWAFYAMTGVAHDNPGTAKQFDPSSARNL